MKFDEGWIECEGGVTLLLSEGQGTDPPFYLQESPARAVPAQIGTLHAFSDNVGIVRQIEIQEVPAGARVVWPAPSQPSENPSPQKPRSWNEVPRNCKMEAE